MNNIQIPDVVKELVDNGINVTIMKSDTYGYCFDLHLQAKSHMHLFEDAGQLRVAMRYDEVFAVEDLEDLKHYARHGMHGQPYISSEWAKLIGEPR